MSRRYTQVEHAVLSHIRDLANRLPAQIAPAQAVQFLADQLCGNRRVIRGLRDAGALAFDNDRGGYAPTPSGAQALNDPPIPNSTEPFELPEGAMRNLAEWIRSDPSVLDGLRHEHLERAAKKLAPADPSKPKRSQAQKPKRPAKQTRTPKPRPARPTFSDESLALCALRDLHAAEKCLATRPSFDGLWNYLTCELCRRLLTSDECGYIDEAHALRSELLQAGFLTKKYGGLGGWWTRWTVSQEGLEYLLSNRPRFSSLPPIVTPEKIDDIVSERDSPPDLAKYHRRLAEIVADRKCRA